MYASSALPASLFDATNGIGLSILRLGMDTAGMGNLQSSSMSADIKTVNSAGGKVIGSVWSPPSNCKSNMSTNNGGHLNTGSCYMSWATTITNFASTNKLYAMGVANEPEFASCGMAEPCNGTYPTAVFTATEMVNFVKVVGPMLQAKGVKVIAPEVSEWNHLWSNQSACGSEPSGLKSSDPLNCGCFIWNGTTPTASGASSSTCMTAAMASCSSTCMSGGGYDYGHALHADSTAWAAFDIVGTHEYDDQTAFAWPSAFAKDKEVWMTEMAGVKWWYEQGPSTDINDGIVVAQWIHSALVTGQVSAWLWWAYVPPNPDNEGLVLMDGSTDTKRRYTLGNYAKFVRPGAVRVQVGGAFPAGVLVSAFKNMDGTVAIVAINSNASAQMVSITFAGGTAPASLTPNVTSAMVSLKAGTAVTVSSSSFMASLDANTVTTFVGK
jgi:O-glycosyl hydrolase